MIPSISFKQQIEQYLESIKCDPEVQEETFAIIPIGKRYICEICQEGEMRWSGKTDSELNMPGSTLHSHTCTKCNGNMKLPKIYPYIDWVPGNTIAVGEKRL